VARTLAGAEQYRRHIVAVENRRLTRAILGRKLDARNRRERLHEIETAQDVVVAGSGLDLARHPSDGRHATPLTGLPGRQASCHVTITAAGWSGTEPQPHGVGQSSTTQG